VHLIDSSASLTNYSAFLSNQPVYALALASSLTATVVLDQAMKA
jgi:hypothetical protein